MEGDRKYAVICLWKKLSWSHVNWIDFDHNMTDCDVLCFVCCSIASTHSKCQKELDQSLVTWAGMEPVSLEFSSEIKKKKKEKRKEKPHLIYQK